MSPECPLTRDPPARTRSKARRVSAARVAAPLLLVGLGPTPGCRDRDRAEANAAAQTGVAALTGDAPRPLVREASDASAPPVVRVSELARAAAPDACPPTMMFVPGGEFWMGSARGRGGHAERPRFLTQIADFCLDSYEVTSSSYEACVRSGACSQPRGAQSRCNYGRREDHPINCVDWGQADAYCKAQGSRLPTEAEWEYAARGGDRYLPFSWGSEPPDGRTCWKANRSCPVGSFGTGAFGLHDMSGNVWEWTADWFGDYPWPAPGGSTKVFRGGGFNGQSERWLGATLRNRTDPARWGSYLGFRCARLAKEALCPFGAGDEPGRCRHGVLDVECSGAAERFNGQRCATADAPACEPPSVAVAGHGCVRR